MAHFTLSTAAAVVAVFFSNLVNEVAADAPLHTHLSSFQEGDLGQVPNQTFFSSDITAPVYQVNTFVADKVDPAPYIFITGGYDGYGPSIISSKDFSLIWTDHRYFASQAHRTFTFKGQTVLAVHTGDAIRIYNQHYEPLYLVRPQGEFSGMNPDTHEALLTDDDTVVMVFTQAEDMDLGPIGIPEIRPGLNCYVQEVDPVTNEVKFQWNTWDFFHLEDSYWPFDGEGPYHLNAGFDPFHMNSIVKVISYDFQRRVTQADPIVQTPEGDFLVSYRHFHSIILIEGQTGQVKWCLGGKRNMFRDITVDGTAEFHWQHNARFSGSNRITFFDNHSIHNGYCTDGGCSRGLEVELDFDAMTVKMVNQWYHPQGLVSASRGGVQRTPNGNVLIAWGQNPMYTEHAPDGEVVMDIQRGQVLPLDHGIVPVIAYRAWKSDWVGKPTSPPSIAANTDESGTTSVYVSWNGATEVDRYVLLTSDLIDGLNGKDPITATSPRTGFETSFRLNGNSTLARIAALNDKDEIIGYTGAVNTKTGQVVPLDYPIDDLDVSQGAQDRILEVSAWPLALVVFAIGLSIVLAVVFGRTRSSVAPLPISEEEEGLVEGQGKDDL